jgi:hypothetical protein
MLNLLGVHEPGTNGANESLSPNGPISEGDKDVVTDGRFSDPEISRLDRRVYRIGIYADGPTQGGFDLLERHTVLLTLLTVSVVPVETRKRIAHLGILAYVCTNVHTQLCLVAGAGQLRADPFRSP